MSSENSDVTPQSDDCDQATSAGPTLIEQDHMEGSYSTHRGDDPQQAAISALLQLRTRANPDTPQDLNTYTPWKNRNTHGHNGLTSSEENRTTYSRSWTTPYTTTSAPDNTTGQHNPYHAYSQATMQSTITGLTSAINNLQQEHLTMNTRQDSITGTLEQVLSALQELKSANTTSSQYKVVWVSLLPQLETVTMPILIPKEVCID